MQRDTALALVLALLALLAIGIAAATLDNPATSSAGGSGFGSGSGSGFATGDDSAPPNGTNASAPPSARLEGTGLCQTGLDTAPVRAGLFLAVAGLSGLVAYRTRLLSLGVVVFLATGLVTYFIWSLLTLCGPLTFPKLAPSPGAPLGQVNNTGNASGGGLDGAVNTATSQPSLLLGVLLVLAIAAGVLLLVVASGDTDRAAEEEDAEEAEAEPDVAAVGRAAGRAADRIDAAADVGNEVYRAWAEMTDHLAVDHPESSTPAEFADAAVDAGMSPDDVRELTDLFEEVRYGDYEPTPEREQRAVDALRRIESSYAADESGEPGSRGTATDDDLPDGPGGDDER